MPAPWYHWEGEDIVLLLHVQPGASHDMLAGIVDDRLKIRVTAPPANGRANAHLLRFLAGIFGVPRSRVELLSGHGNRYKRVRIIDPRKLPEIIVPPRD